MVSSLSITGMVIQLSISILFPIGLIIFLRKKGLFSWKPFGIGVLVFILFAQVFEKILHVVMIEPSGLSLKWSDSTYLFVLYAVLAAGIFEEFGRYFGFKWLLKKHREYKDGLSFGLGHGGIEAVLIGGLAAVNAIVIAFMINSGAFDQTIALNLPAEQANLIKVQLLGATFGEFLLAGFERVAAITVHIALSLLVLLGIHNKRFVYVLYAVLLHALLDVVPALYQVGVITNIWVAEVVIYLFGIGAFFFIRNLKEQF
jgi:uncharacterized membrane protein YhfC